jgi:hypothetical protein
MTSPTSSPTEAAPIRTARFLDRYILATVADKTLVFPATWVVEIIKVAQSQVLNLPLYQSPLFGVTHHNGKVLPLITVHPLFKVNMPSSEVLTVVHLGAPSNNIPAMGLMIDRLVGSCLRSDLPAALFAESGLAEPGFTESGAMSSAVDGFIRFSLDLLPESTWQPSYWQLDALN